MKKSSVRLVIFGLLLAAATMSMSSCNKGYGCPTDFSIGHAIPSLINLK